MPAEFRRGGAAIQEATEKSGQGGDFKPFLPSIYWKNDKESKYVLFLTPVEGFLTADMIHFIKTENGYFESVFAKTEPAIGESVDPLVRDWGAQVKTTTLGIAVELEPVMEKVGTRTKPTSFIVATKEFTRKVIDDDGNDTGEEEEVTTPVVGYISQSPNNFYCHVGEWDATESPVNETPLKITRSGEKKNVSYNVVGYDVEVDLAPLFDYLDGVTYLGDDLEDLVNEIADQEPFEATATIGEVLLTKRIEELADPERYDELYAGVDESMDRYGKKKDKKSERKAPTRTAKPSARSASKEEPAEDSEPAESDEPEAKPAKKATKAKAATKGASPQEKLAVLRAKAESKA